MVQHILKIYVQKSVPTQPKTRQISQEEEREMSNFDEIRVRASTGMKRYTSSEGEPADDAPATPSGLDPGLNLTFVFTCVCMCVCVCHQFTVLFE